MNSSAYTHTMNQTYNSNAIYETEYLTYLMLLEYFCLNVLILTKEWKTSQLGLSSGNLMAKKTQHIKIMIFTLFINFI